MLVRALPGRAAFVGRASELSALVGLCRSGPGGVALLIGDAGSGKSRLLSEVAARTGSASTVVMQALAKNATLARRPMRSLMIPLATQPQKKATMITARYKLEPSTDNCRSCRKKVGRKVVSAA